MDKKVIFAVAGSGKTTYIIDSLTQDKRSLIVTYTVGTTITYAARFLQSLAEYGQRIFGS